MRLNKLHWLSAVFVFAIISGVVVHLIISADEKPRDQQFYLPALSASPAVLSPLAAIDTEVSQSETGDIGMKKQQVTALTIKLAELQSQVLRLNALGERLADNANIPEEEFNFQQFPPSGGPSNPASEISPMTFSQLLKAVSNLDVSLKYEENQLQMLESLNLGHHIENSRYLSGRPISKGWLSSYYGIRKDPFNGRPAMHKGIDFAGKEDGAIIATASGIVSWADKRYGYGQLVEINHGDGLKTRYGHNKELLVNVGDVVTKGQVIARMGSTGRSTGPHVHYEILLNDKQINPLKFVYRKAK